MMIRRTALTLSMPAALVVTLLAFAVGCGGQSEGASRGGVAHLRFVLQHALPASKRVDVPGTTRFDMGLGEGRIESTGTNAAGESLIEASSTLRIDGGAPVGKGRVSCLIHAEKRGTRIAVTSGGLDALYPRPSEVGIYDQEVPPTVLMKFRVDGYRLAELKGGIRPDRFTSVRGVLLTWPEAKPGTERLNYELPRRATEGAIELPFFTVWRARGPSPFKVACALAVPRGTATVETEG